jgi:RecB family endonuclease NucS
MARKRWPNFRERRMQDYIVRNFDTLLPEYYYITQEIYCETGRIDILAGEKASAVPYFFVIQQYRQGRSVIIELKNRRR